MATRARIGIENADGSITTSYHHWDGYPAGLGFNLVNNWADEDLLGAAIALGDASPSAIASASVSGLSQCETRLKPSPAG